MGTGPLRAVSGPDRVAPSGVVLGLDGSRSTSPSGRIGYDWKVVQVPEGDPNLVHYPQTGFPGPILVDPDTLRLDGTTADLNCFAGSDEISFTVGGLPYDLSPHGIQVGDVLVVTAGPNAGVYSVASNPYGVGPNLDKLQLDQPMLAAEVTAAYSLSAPYSNTVTMNYDPAATSLEDILIIGGIPTKIVGLPGPTTVEVEDGLPYAGQSFDHAMVIRSEMIRNSGTAYPSFVPAVQGVYAVRLYVYDTVTFPPARSEADISVVSSLAAGTAPGLPVDGSWLWRSIGDFWNMVSDKDWMETSWRTFIRVMGSAVQESWNVQASYSLGTCQDVAMSRWVGYEPLLEETDPDTALLERRFAPVFSAELPAAGPVFVDLLVYDVPAGTTLSLTPDVADLPDAVNDALTAAGIAGIKARVEVLEGTRHLTIRSETHVFTALGALFGAGRRNVFEGFGLRIDAHTFWLVDAPPLAPTLYGTNYDADRTLRKGDIINIGGTSYTITSSGQANIPPAYPFTYVSVEEEIPDAGPGYSYPFVIPSYFYSAEVDYKYELVTPGDRVVVEVEGSDGVLSEGTEEVVGAGVYRLGVTSPNFFCTGRTVKLKSVLRLFYVPVDETHLSIPVLKESAEASAGWKEYEHFVVAERWGRRAIVFDFLSEQPDALYTSVTRTFGPPPPAKPPYPPDRLWAEIVYVDQRPELAIRFGNGLGFPLESVPKRTGFSYQRALLGLWFCYLRGSKPGMLERGMSIICGAPFFEADGTVVDARVLSSEKGYLIVQDAENREILRGYIYPFSVGLDINPATGEAYKVGDTVRRFDTVSNAAVYRDYISDPDFIQALIASGAITEPEKIHRFWLSVDVDILGPDDRAAVRAAYEWLLTFRTTYNLPFFGLLKRLEDTITISDVISFKVTLNLFAYLGARWGGPTLDRLHLAGSLDPWPGMPVPAADPPDTGIHNYLDTVLDGREHYAAVRLDPGPPAVAVYEIRHVAPDGTLGDVVDPQRAGVQPGHLFVLAGETPDPVTVVSAADITLTIPAPLPSGPTFAFSISGAPNWAGLDDCLVYLRDYVHILVRDMSGGAPGVLVDELIEPPPAGYPGPEPTSEVP